MVQPPDQRSGTLFQYSNILQMFSVCGTSKLFSSVTFKLQLMTVSSGIKAFSLFSRDISEYMSRSNWFKLVASLPLVKNIPYLFLETKKNNKCLLASVEEFSLHKTTAIWSTAIFKNNKHFLNHKTPQIVH